MDLNTSRHPIAIWYNELGNRREELLEMMQSTYGDFCEMFGHAEGSYIALGSMDQVEEITQEMASLRRMALSDEEWADHWLLS